MQTEFARKIVIIGASAGGAGVAAKLRRLNENAEILLIEKSRAISYATCGIPYYIGNVIKDDERMQAHSSEEFAHLLSVDIRVRHELLSIDRRQQSLAIRDLASGKVYQETYDTLVLALGSRPSGSDWLNTKFTAANLRDNKHDNKRDNKHNKNSSKDSNNKTKRPSNVFVIRGYEETAVIKHYIHAKSCRRAVVVGAGFIGVEMAENLARLGLQVCLVDRAGQILHQCDPEIAAVVHRHVRDKKVSIMLNESLAEVSEDGITLESGKKIAADITLLAIGVKANTEIAQECGLSMGRQGGILVNTGMCSSDPNIYAVGDVAEIKDAFGRTSVMSQLAGPAQKQARVVAENIAGRHVTYQATHKSAIVKVFNLSVANCGYSESELKARHIAYLKSYTESASHATFYPGAQSMLSKLLFSPEDGKILGAQIVGAAGVDKRIDVLSAAMYAKLTVRDLADMDLSYAPPYGSAKDPINIAGMVACNQLYDEDYQVMHWDQVDKAIAQGVVLLDVRTEVEFELRSLPGAVNIPLEQLRDRIDEIDKRQPILTYCGYGKKGYFASKILKHYGFSQVFNLSGGLTVYTMSKTQGVTAMQAHRARPRKERNAATHKLVDIQPVNGNMTGEAADFVQIQDAQDTLVDAYQDIQLGELDGFDVDVASGEADLPAENNELNFDELVLAENIVLEDSSSEPPQKPRAEVAYIEVDATGLSCPGPIMKLAKTMHHANMGDVVQIIATDAGFAHDIQNWCQKKGHKLLDFDDSSSTIRATLLKS